jgi:hypothetical protein
VFNGNCDDGDRGWVWGGAGYYPYCDGSIRGSTNGGCGVLITLYSVIISIYFSNFQEHIAKYEKFRYENSLFTLAAFSSQMNKKIFIICYCREGQEKIKKSKKKKSKHLSEVSNIPCIY